MLPKKEDLLIFIFAGILLVIVIVIAAIALTSKGVRDTNVTSLSPTPLPPVKTIPPVQYNVQDEKKNLNIINTRPQLSPADVEVRKKIIASIPGGNQSGVVYESSNVRIDYIQPHDIFQGEVLTVNITQAKQEASNWLRSQGLSQEGICILPIEFYLNYPIASQLQDTNTEFSTLPLGCN